MRFRGILPLYWANMRILLAFCGLTLDRNSTLRPEPLCDSAPLLLFRRNGWSLRSVRKSRLGLLLNLRLSFPFSSSIAWSGLSRSAPRLVSLGLFL